MQGMVYIKSRNQSNIMAFECNVKCDLPIVSLSECTDSSLSFFYTVTGNTKLCYSIDGTATFTEAETNPLIIEGLEECTSYAVIFRNKCTDKDGTEGISEDVAVTQVTKPKQCPNPLLVLCSALCDEVMSGMVLNEILTRKNTDGSWQLVNDLVPVINYLTSIGATNITQAQNSAPLPNTQVGGSPSFIGQYLPPVTNVNYGAIINFDYKGCNLTLTGGSVVFCPSVADVLISEPLIFQCNGLGQIFGGVNCTVSSISFTLFESGIYCFRYKKEGERDFNLWRGYQGDTISVSGLEPCTSYLFEVQRKCPQNQKIKESDIVAFDFSTKCCSVDVDFKLLCDAGGRIDVDLDLLTGLNEGAAIQYGATCESADNPLYEFAGGSWQTIGVPPVLDCVTPEFEAFIDDDGNLCFRVVNDGDFTVESSNDGVIFSPVNECCTQKPFLDGSVQTVNQPPQQLPQMDIVNTSGTIYTLTIASSSTTDITNFQNFIGNCTYAPNLINFQGGSLLLSSTAITSISTPTAQTLEIVFDASLIQSPCIQPIINNTNQSLENAPISTNITGLRCLNEGNCNCYFRLTRCGHSKTYKIVGQSQNDYSIYIGETLIYSIEDGDVTTNNDCLFCCPISFSLKAEMLNDTGCSVDLCRTFVPGDCDPCEGFTVLNESGVIVQP